MRSKIVVIALLLVCLVLVGLCVASLLEVDWSLIVVVEATETPSLWPIWDGYEAPSPN